jgi:hypothetical protein
MKLADCHCSLAPDGRLSMRLSDSPARTLEIDPWACGLGARVIRNGSSAPSHAWALDLLSAENECGADSPASSFIAAIPETVRATMRRYRFGQCFMLRLCATLPAAVDLAAGNPNLLWLLAVGVYDERVASNEIGALCHKRQDMILGGLIGSASRASVRLLRRIEIGKGYLSEARSILEAVARPEIVAATVHQARVPSGLLQILLRHPQLAETALVAAISDELGRHSSSALSLGNHLVQLVRDLNRLAKALKIDRPDRAIAECRKMHALEALHDRWTRRLTEKLNPLVLAAMRAVNLRPIQRVEPEPGQRLDRNPDRRRAQPPAQQLDRRPPQDRAEPHAQRPVDREPAALTSLVFPPPPLPDTAQIKAIRNVVDLFREGKTQQHCVVTYAHSIASGESYIYRLLQPQRATLELRRDGNDWVVGQFKLGRNREPGLKARRIVDEWLAQARDAAR